MKRAAGIVLLIVASLSPHPTGPTPIPPGPNPAAIQGLDLGLAPQEEPLLPYPSEQTILPPKKLQKTLSPMTKKERVVWAFRTAKANVFL